MIPTLTRTSQHTLTGNTSGLTGDVSGLTGDVSGLWGDVTGLRGDVSGLRGDVTGLRGNVDTCGLTDTDRARGVDVSRLVVAAAEVPA